MSDAVLRTEAVDVRFGGLRALANTSVDAQPSTITGLIGPNGAGKTTLFNVITGLQNPAAGRVLLGGPRRHPLRRAQAGPHRASRGRSRSSKRSTRCRPVTTCWSRPRWRRTGIPSITDPARFTDEILERVGLSDVAELTVGTLPTGTARLVELARALAGHPKILLLDEASSGLTEDETTAVGDLLRSWWRRGRLRRAARRARHELRDAGLLAHPRARLRADHRRRLPERDPDTTTQVRTAYLGSAAA